MKITKTHLEGVYIIEATNYNDERGFFRETFRSSLLEEKTGYCFDLAQQNHSRSKKNVLRGIHRAPWSKLIYCPYGKIQSVIVDLREESGTFGKYVSTIIGDENPIQIFIPPYVGNSFLVLSDEADYIYLTDQEYTPNKEIGVLWNDPSLKIKWETNNPRLSARDKENPLLETVFKR